MLELLTETLQRRVRASQRLHQEVKEGLSTGGICSKILDIYNLSFDQILWTFDGWEFEKRAEIKTFDITPVHLISYRQSQSYHALQCLALFDLFNSPHQVTVRLANLSERNLQSQKSLKVWSSRSERERESAGDWKCLPGHHLEVKFEQPELQAAFQTGDGGES